MNKIRNALIVAAVLFSAPALAGHFDGWHKFGSGSDGSGWYLFADSVKPIHHVKTGKLVGGYVWAGWSMPDGSYSQGRYSVYCEAGTYTMDGGVQGNSVGVEVSLPLIFKEPYRPQTFQYILAGVVCH
jgi:hypothetical protein